MESRRGGANRMSATDTEHVMFESPSSPQNKGAGAKTWSFGAKRGTKKLSAVSSLGVHLIAWVSVLSTARSTKIRLHIR